MKTKLNLLLMACVILVGFTVNAHAGYSALAWREPGSSTLSDDTIYSCGAARTIDIRVSYSLNNVFVIGEYDPNCPAGFGSNPFRYTVNLFRDGIPIGSHSFQSYGCWFRDWFEGIPAIPGNYYATIKFERRLGPFVWQDVDSMQSPSLVAAKLNAVPNFTINGMPIPNDGSPITVKIANPIIVDGSVTACATRYLIGVQESDNWWNRTYEYEWTKWFEGAPPKNINLQQLATNYSVPPFWLGNDATRQGTPLFGGTFPSGAQRFYRVSLCTTEPSWNCKGALIRVE